MSAIILYIDPASTSALLYILVALLATLVFTLRGFFYRVKNLLLGKGFVNGKDFEKADIIFYSEGKQYWPVFQPIVNSLGSRGVPCAYLTSDKDDPGLGHQAKHFESRYIGNLTMTSVYLNRLKAKFVGMTTPQLDVMMLRRSKNVQHYGHIIHAPIDIFTYRKFAFDYYDSVFCSGPHQIEGIQKLEEQRGTNKKLLLETGLTYYDVMIDEVKKMSVPKKKNQVVLVAPTWKEYSIINRFGTRFFECLLKDSTYQIIFRPHPQSYVSFPKLMDEIEDHLKDEPRVTIDRNQLGTESMARSDMMISDLSGVFWDYTFLYSKPVLLLKTEFDTIEGFEGSELDYEMWEMRERGRLGKEFDENDLDNISTIVGELLQNPPSVQLEKLRKESVYNFGQAGEVAARQILEIVNNNMDA
ncbi:MAG: CDP-glycerol glycerophosphotransferase family protein [Bacteroidales bacterium]